MTVIDVDTDVYTEAGRALAAAASSFFTGVDSQWSTLSNCEDMCGSYAEAVTWAGEYDTKANEVMDQALAVAEAASTYSNTLLELGYLHALADHNANMTPGPAPAEPQYPGLLGRLVCRPPLPSAGGPGEGLEEIAGKAIGLLSEIGVVVPDGDTTKLGTAADTWTKIAATPEVSGFVAEVERIANLFSPITVPELEHLDEDLRAIRTAAEEVLNGIKGLAASTTTHRDELVSMRNEIQGFLESLVQDIAIEMAVTATITIAASFITFGAATPAGAAIAASRVVVIVRRWAPAIKRGIDAFKLRGLTKVADKVPDFGWSRKEMERLKALRNRNTGRPGSGTNWGTTLSPRDQQVLQVGPNYRGVDLSTKLRRGENLTPEEQAYLNDYNAALEKLPIHQGPVVRHDPGMTPERLAQMEPGSTWTDDGIMSASTNPAGVQDQFVQNSPVELRIMPRTARDYHDPDGNFGPYGTPDEVVIPQGAPYYIHKKYWDPQLQKVVVEMSELPR